MHKKLMISGRRGKNGTHHRRLQYKDNGEAVLLEEGNFTTE